MHSNPVELVQNAAYWNVANEVRYDLLRRGVAVNCSIYGHRFREFCQDILHVVAYLIDIIRNKTWL